jgi:hypothetical protein
VLEVDVLEDVSVAVTVVRDVTVVPVVDVCDNVEVVVEDVVDVDEDEVVVVVEIER